MAHGYSTRLHGDAYLELPTVALRDASCHGRLLRYHLLMSSREFPHVMPPHRARQAAAAQNTGRL